MNRSYLPTVLVTLTFSICLCLVGPVGSDHKDPFSLWLIEHLSTASANQLSGSQEIRTAMASRSSSGGFDILEWGRCILAGLLTVLLFICLPLIWSLAASSILMLLMLGLPVVLWEASGMLAASSVPILCIGFGYLAAFLFLQPRPGQEDDPSPHQAPESLDRNEASIGKDQGLMPGRPIDQDAPDNAASGPEDPTEKCRPRPLTEPTLTIGRYEIIRTIGRGAMGEVFLGRDPHINRLTAVKTVRFEDRFAEDDIEQVKGKFFREAESAGTLSHPHIVTIYDAGENGNTAYIAMEFLEGSTLLRFSRRQRLLPLRRLINYMIQVAEALDYAHTQGVTHRDIKPANIMLMQTGQIKITDFGIAHIATSSQTQTGVVKGTPYYMSPEQFSGQKVDGRSDIFSLGTTMFQLLTGTLPFYADSPALLMNQIMNFPHPNPRAINPRVVPAMISIVDKTLAKDRGDRYQTARELVLDLRRLDKRIKAALRKGHGIKPMG